MKNVDMISMINSLLNSSNFNINREYVYVYQNDLNHPLTQKERLECRMDTATKSIALASIRGDSAIPNFKTSQIGYGRITCDNRLITSKIQSTLHTYTPHNPMIAWLEAYSTPAIYTKKVNLHWPSFATARKIPL